MIVATANFGRAKTAGPVRESMAAVAKGLPRNAILCTQEIDEGDKTHPTDHVLLRDAFAGWDLEHMATREPIVVGRGWKLIGDPVCTRTMPGVHRESPPREVVERVVTRGKGLETATLGGHYPTNVHNGKQGRGVDPVVIEGYAHMLEVHRERIAFHHAAGRNVVWAMDTNWHAFPRLHPDEVTLVHEGPDWVRAIPAPGRTVKAGDTGSIPMTIERLHACHWAKVAFPKVG